MPGQLNTTVKQILVWVVMITLLVVLWEFVGNSFGMPKQTEITASTLMSDVAANKVKDVTVSSTGTGSSDVTGHYKGAKDPFHTTIPATYPDLYKIMQDHGVELNVKDQNSMFWPVALQVVPVLVLILIAPIVIIPPFWQIFKKAGFPAPLSFLMIVPLVNLCSLYFLAFSTWKTPPVEPLER